MPCLHRLCSLRHINSCSGVTYFHRVHVALWVRAPSHNLIYIASGALSWTSNMCCSPENLFLFLSVLTENINVSLLEGGYCYFSWEDSHWMHRLVLCPVSLGGMVKEYLWGEGVLNLKTCGWSFFYWIEYNSPPYRWHAPLEKMCICKKVAVKAVFTLNTFFFLIQRICFHWRAKSLMVK